MGFVAVTKNFIRPLILCYFACFSTTLNAQNVKSNPDLIHSRLNRWVEVLARESLSKSYENPLQGVYRFDWEMLVATLNSLNNSKVIEAAPALKALLKENIFLPHFPATQQRRWVLTIKDERNNFFKITRPVVYFTRQSQITAAFERINESLDAYQNEIMPPLKWMFLWDASVEAIRLNQMLALKAKHPWDEILGEARLTLSRTSLPMDTSLISGETLSKAFKWMDYVQGENQQKGESQQNHLAWFLFVREGIESLIVLFCIVSGLALAYKRWVFVGAVSAFFSSFLFYFLLRYFVALNPVAEWIRYFVLANVVLSLGLLLLATNFNFHQVYWSGWISKLKVKSWARGALFTAGFFAIFREGVELSLAMSLISLESGSDGVFRSLLLALPIWIALGLCLFVLHKKLPLKNILLISGGFMLLVTVVFAGFAMRLLQAFNWVDSTPLISKEKIPSWVENVFAFNGTLESIVFMGLIAAFLLIPAWSALSFYVQKALRKLSGSLT